jgi:protein O-mannosyl-transferase
VLIAVLVFWAYFAAIPGGYLWDDDAYVQENTNLRDAEGLGRIWVSPSSSPQYYPLVFSSFWIERRVFGESPVPHHVVNIALHALNAILLWRLLRRLDVPGAYLASLVFALHPVHVESVAWMTERKNVLSGAFFLASMCVSLRWAIPGLRGDQGAWGVDGTRRPGLTWAYLASLLLFIGALLSKTVTATLPAAILIVIWWKRGRVGTADLVRLIPFVVIGGAFGAMTAWTEVHHVGASGVDWQLRGVERVLLAGRIVWFYLWKILWPHPLAFVYPRWVVSSADPIQYVAPLALLGVVVWLWLKRHRIGRGPLAAVVFFVAALFPALGFFDVYPMRFSFVADHFQYLASVGPIAAIVAGGAVALSRLAPKAVPAVAAIAVVTALGATARAETAKFGSTEVLWQDTLAKNPAAWIAHNNLGNMRLKDGRLGEARTHLQAAVRLKPDLAEAHNNLGAAEYGLGNTAEAIRQHQSAVRIDPGYAEAWNNLGVALAADRRDDEAVHAYRRALSVSPGYATAHFNLGNAFLRADAVAQAEAEYREAIRLNPGLAMAHFSLGLSLLSGPRASEAAKHLETAFRLRPDFAAGYFQVGNVELRQERVQSAVTYYSKAITARREYPEASCNRGTAFMRLGRVDEAIADFREAVRLRPGYAIAEKNLQFALETAAKVASSRVPGAR